MYIPLGGNRGGLAKQLRNIAVVWLPTGFWHGASWIFVLWGVYFGVLPALEKLFLLIKGTYGNTFSQFPVEDYAEVHVIDLRFFRGDMAAYAAENGITETLVLYGTQNFVKDTRLPSL